VGGIPLEETAWGGGGGGGEERKGGGLSMGVLNPVLIFVPTSSQLDRAHDAVGPSAARLRLRSAHNSAKSGRK